MSHHHHTFAMSPGDTRRGLQCGVTSQDGGAARRYKSPTPCDVMESGDFSMDVDLSGAGGAYGRNGQWVTLSKSLLLQLVERICQLSFQPDNAYSSSSSSSPQSTTASWSKPSDHQQSSAADSRRRPQLSHRDVTADRLPVTSNTSPSKPEMTKSAAAKTAAGVVDGQDVKPSCVAGEGPGESTVLPGVDDTEGDNVEQLTSKQETSVASDDQVALMPLEDKSLPTLLAAAAAGSSAAGDDGPGTEPNVEGVSQSSSASCRGTTLTDSHGDRPEAVTITSTIGMPTSGGDCVANTVSTGSKRLQQRASDDDAEGNEGEDGRPADCKTSRLSASSAAAAQGRRRQQQALQRARRRSAAASSRSSRITVG